MKRSLLTIATFLLGGTTLAAYATEKGQSVDSNGAENFVAGALPPPGLYALEVGDHYQASRFTDDAGHNLGIPGFRVRVDAVANGLLWMTGSKVLGGDLGAIVLVPLIDLNVSVGGVGQRKSGVGDIKIGVGVGYHHSATLHTVAGLDVFLPTGAYDKDDQANLGKNHAALQAVYIVTLIDPDGFNGDLKMGYAVSSQNRATRFTSGNEFHADYAAGWGLGHGWTAGVGGYLYRQVTDDAGPGATRAHGSAVALGPSVKYDSGKGWFATLKFEDEFAVRNRTEGKSVWLKVAFPV